MSSNTSLRLSYSLLAPLYDRVVAKATATMRQRSLSAIKDFSLSQTILINGIGSGLDLPYLPMEQQRKYFGLDLTANMLKRAKQRVVDLDCHLQIGNAMQLPYRSASFDVVILHLILAVTPNPKQTLREACRVLKPGGHVLIMDKFLRPGQIAPLRRLFSPLIGLFATQTHIVWENILQATQHQLQQESPAIRIQTLSDEPDLGGGWFRRIIIQRTH